MDSTAVKEYLVAMFNFVPNAYISSAVAIYSTNKKYHEGNIEN